MVLKPDQERVRTLLQDTITLLCRNGLNYKMEFDIKALIGITLDRDEVFLVDIKETIKNSVSKDDDSDEDNNENDDAAVLNSPSRKRQKQTSGRRKRSHSDVESATSDSVPGTPGNSRVKAEELDDDSNGDAIIIKDEPDFDTTNYGSQHHHQQHHNTDILGNLSQAQLYQTTPESLQSAWDTSTSSQQYTPIASSQNHPAITSSSSLNNLASASMSSPLQQQQQPRLTLVDLRGRGGDRRCSVCGKQFSTDNGLLYHENQHRGHSPYVCKLCGWGCSSTSSLSGHMVSHHGLKAMRFSCPVCAASFTRKDSMMLHCRKTHGQYPPAPPTTLPPPPPPPPPPTSTNAVIPTPEQAISADFNQGTTDGVVVSTQI